jgi:hypothetical protein
MFQVFRLFQRYVAIVSYECCVYQNVAMVVHIYWSIPNVSSVFLDVLLQKCLYGCCIRFTHILQIFYLDIAYVCNGFQVFFICFISVSETCFKGFICLQTYVVSVASKCFKSKSGRALHMFQCM